MQIDKIINNEQLKACRAAFEKWAEENSQEFRHGNDYTERHYAFVGFKAAWESRPAVQADGDEEAEWFYAEDGDYVQPWAEEVARDADLDSGGLMMVHGAKEVCTKWVAHVIISRDEDGDPDETDMQVFDTKEQAEQALSTKEETN